jgi:hypothetical protein
MCCSLLHVNDCDLYTIFSTLTTCRDHPWHRQWAFLVLNSTSLAPDHARHFYAAILQDSTVCNYHAATKDYLHSIRA